MPRASCQLLLATHTSNCLITLLLFSLGYNYRKARRKDKDVNAGAGDESKQYLEAAILECIAPEYKLREIVNLPEGVDYNEWIASHSKRSVSVFHESECNSTRA